MEKEDDAVTGWVWNLMLIITVSGEPYISFLSWKSETQKTNSCQQESVFVQL